LAGQGGDDVLSGGNNSDKLYGGTGADSILGGDGDDLALGGWGNDSILGGAGDDTLEGNQSNDTLEGGTGADELTGGLGEDVIFGGAGNDVIWGYEDGVEDGKFAARDVFDRDALAGGDGNDTLYLGSGDQVAGTDDAGNDTLITGTWVDPKNVPEIQGFDARFDSLVIYYKAGDGGALEVSIDDNEAIRLQTIKFNGVSVATVDYGEGSRVALASIQLVASNDFV